MRRGLLMTVAATCVAGAVLLAGAAPAGACAALVAPNGTIRLLRTATLAAYHDGLEHYVTSFQFAGEGEELGSIIPLPGIPSNVERGGDWTLQRLDRETHTQPAAARASSDNLAAASGGAEVLYETKIDALDITILKGGGTEVGKWAVDHGFALSPDAPEVLDFYSRRSPIFMAARFDATAARERGQSSGDGTPIHLTIPTRNPWVPLRILGLGHGAQERIDADVYLLTPRRPVLLPKARGLDLRYNQAASESLLNDLRSDKGMEWVPSSMWLTYLGVDEQAGKLTYDLAVDASGRGTPSYVAAGLRPPRPPVTTTAATATTLPSTTLAPATTLAPPVALAARPASSERLTWIPWAAAASILVGVASFGIVLRRRTRVEE